MIQIVCDLLNVFEKWKGQCLLYLLKIKLVDIRFIWFKVHCIYGSNVKWANLINAVQKESFMVIGATMSMNTADEDVDVLLISCGWAAVIIVI